MPSYRIVVSSAVCLLFWVQDMLQAGLIVAGWDATNGGTVHSIPLGGTALNVPFTIGGSGSAYISGLCDKLWKVRSFFGRSMQLLAPVESTLRGACL